METNRELIRFLTDHAGQLAEDVVERVSGLLGDVTDEELKQARLMYAQLWKALADTLRTGELRVPEALMRWSRSNAAIQTKNSGSIAAVADRYPPSRDAIADLLLEISEQLGVSLKEYAHLSKLVNRFLDLSLQEKYYAYERLSKLYQSDAEDELAELSAPVVPVYDGIVIIPFIGRITDDRAYAIMNKVLPKVAEMNVTCTIADFSGLAAVDDHIMHLLQQVEGALELMGIHVISTGIRPHLAQSIVNSGQALAGRSYYGNVKLALESIIK
ncbi:STAS domain-containing protein [Sporosarcina trichiuri]|uniref:STAS domain-containing protein n=1 Tax=Sporosarcina trichiuri TaxID=3056445 RepID=UPI0025B58437|nr:STAS domain-containing protein [Sporosarcina sp. 0.2-SM1T-5]WJY26295.1 STAS domain-containing protein [Sporosarcina sp. 0.2-SM1T-5]